MKTFITTIIVVFLAWSAALAGDKIEFGYTVNDLYQDTTNLGNDISMWLSAYSLDRTGSQRSLLEIYGFDHSQLKSMGGRSHDDGSVFAGHTVNFNDRWDLRAAAYHLQPHDKKDTALTTLGFTTNVYDGLFKHRIDVEADMGKSIGFAGYSARLGEAIIGATHTEYEPGEVIRMANIGFLWEFSDNWYAGAGVADNLSTDIDLSWVASFSHVVPVWMSREPNPDAGKYKVGLYARYGEKIRPSDYGPLKSQHGMLILTWGPTSSLNQFSGPGMMYASIKNTAKPFRIFRDSEWDIPIGRSTSTYEMGELVLYGVYIKTDMTSEVQIEEARACLFHTPYWEYGIIKKVYGGLSYCLNSEIYFSWPKLHGNTREVYRGTAGCEIALGSKTLNTEVFMGFNEGIEEFGVILRAML